MKHMIEDFKNGEFVVNCKTNKEADDFSKICNDNNITWGGREMVLGHTNWCVYAENTCYSFQGSLSYSPIGYYSGCGRKVISFQDFTLVNNSKKENVLKIIGVEVGKPFNVSGDKYNPYVFDDSYNLIDKDGDKREDLIFAMLCDDLKIEKIPEDPNTEVKKYIELLSTATPLTKNIREGILVSLKEILELKEQKSA